MVEKSVIIEDEIIYEKEPPKSRIILNRPDSMNALNQEPGGLIDQFVNACLDAKEDDEIRVIIIKGAGRCFSAGYDISEESKEEDWNAFEWEERLAETDTKWEKALFKNPIPSIAQVHSYCLAGAGHLICHADIVYASEDAKFGYPAVRFGSVGAHQLWPHYLGIRKARELLYTGNFLSAEDAQSVGYINRVLPEDELEENVEKLADHIAEMPEQAVRYNKRALNKFLELWSVGPFKDHSAFLESISYGADEKTMPRGLKAFQAKVEEQGLKEALDWRDNRFDEIWADSEYHRGEE